MTTETKLELSGGSPMTISNCPFCGSGAVRVRPNVHSGFHQIQCDGCWATSVTSTNKAMVIAAWNRRADTRPAPCPREVSEGIAQKLNVVLSKLMDDGHLILTQDDGIWLSDAIAEIERLRAPAAESARQQALEEAASLVEAAAHDNSSAWFSGLLANLADSIRALAAWNTRPAPAVEAAQQVYDKLKNLLTMEGSRMSGTPMIPLHEETLFEIAEVLTTVPMERAARDILSERRRQVEAEGWTPKHDDEHFLGELAAASGTYALVASGRYTDVAKRFWPWDFQWWKPGTTRRNLVKAGALILAEIERIDRADALAHPEPEEKA